MKPILVAMALLLGASGMAQAAARCGRATAPVGAGALELSIWQDGAATLSEHATLSIPAQGGRFAMDLAYKPAFGQIGAPTYVQVFAYAPWARQVRHREVLHIGAGRAQWSGPVGVTGLSSRSGREGVAAYFPVLGDRAIANPALIRAFAAGGKVKLTRATLDGSRIKDMVELPRPQALGNAYRATRAQALAALGACPPPVVKPLTAP